LDKLAASFAPSRGKSPRGFDMSLGFAQMTSDVCQVLVRAVTLDGLDHAEDGQLQQ